MKLKINGTPATRALEALEPHAPALYATPGKRIIAIVELAAIERTQVAPDEDKDSSVTLQIKHAEVAAGDHEDPVREVLRALYTHRTAYGKLDEDGDIEVSAETIADCGGRVNAIEAARLHVAVEHWGDYARQASLSGKATKTELARELKTVADALHALIHPDALVKGPAV